MLRWLGANFRTIFLALAMALAVWISAVTAADPNETNMYPELVQVEFIGQDPGLVITGDTSQKVEIALQAPASVWRQMETMDDPVRAIVDLSNLAAGDHEVEIQIQVATRPVRVDSQVPEKISLTLEPLQNRTMAVTLDISGQPAIGYQAEDPVLEPKVIRISGAQSLVRSVASVYILLDITGLRQSVDAPFTMQVLDEEGEVIDGLTLVPDVVNIRLPIIQQGGYRDLAVKVVTRGRPASGYRLTNVSSFPQVVTVYSSDLQLINSLPGYVETTPLELTGVSADIETSLDLNLPAGVTLVGDQNVQVQIGIAPIEGSMTVTNRPVEVINLTQGFKAQISPAREDVILSGPLSVLNTLLSTDVHVILDVDGLTAGTYQVIPTVEIITERVTVESILPGTIEVVISLSNTP